LRQFGSKKNCPTSGDDFDTKRATIGIAVLAMFGLIGAFRWTS
jgi:hypothetical protein